MQMGGCSKGGVLENRGEEQGGGEGNVGGSITGRGRGYVEDKNGECERLGGREMQCMVEERGDGQGHGCTIVGG